MNEQLLPAFWLDPCGIVFACANASGRPAGHKVLSAAVLLIGDGLDRLHVHPLLLSHGSHRRPTRTFRKYGQLTRSWGAAGCGGKATVSSFGILTVPMGAPPDGVGWGLGSNKGPQE